MELFTPEYFELVEDTRKLNNLDDIKSLVLSTNLGDTRLNYFILDYYSDPMYSDGELLKNIERHRGGSQLNGSLTPDLDELRLLMQAFKSPQYNRFMHHIMNAYGNRQIYPIMDDQVFECCICWKKTFGSIMYNRWYANDPSDPKKEHQAFTVDGTKTTICLDCLVQLKTFIGLLTPFVS
jgi:hypothetical protein